MLVTPPALGTFTGSGCTTRAATAGRARRTRCATRRRLPNSASPTAWSSRAARSARASSRPTGSAWLTGVTSSPSAVAPPIRSSAFGSSTRLAVTSRTSPLHTRTTSACRPATSSTTPRSRRPSRRSPRPRPRPRQLPSQAHCRARCRRRPQRRCRPRFLTRFRRGIRRHSQGTTHVLGMVLSLLSHQYVHCKTFASAFVSHAPLLLV